MCTIYELLVLHLISSRGWLWCAVGRVSWSWHLLIWRQSTFGKGHAEVGAKNGTVRREEGAIGNGRKGAGQAWLVPLFKSLHCFQLLSVSTGFQIILPNSSILMIKQSCLKKEAFNSAVCCGFLHMRNLVPASVTISWQCYTNLALFEGTRWWH